MKSFFVFLTLILIGYIGSVQASNEACKATVITARTQSNIVLERDLKAEELPENKSNRLQVFIPAQKSSINLTIVVGSTVGDVSTSISSGGISLSTNGAFNSAGTTRAILNLPTKSVVVVCEKLSSQE